MKKETIKRRKQEIFEASLDVFSQKGFDRATLDEIANKLDISKPAIYLYFKNKEDLFFSMIYEKLNIIMEKLNDIININTSSITKINLVIKSYIDFHKENLKFFKIIYNTHSEIINLKSSMKHKKKILKRYKSYIDKVSTLMQECIKEGYLRKEDKYFYTFSLIGMMNQNIVRFIMFENSEDMSSDISEKVYNQFLQGAKK